MRLTSAMLLYMKAHAGSLEGWVRPATKRRDNAEFRIQSAFVRKWRANCESLGIARCLGFHVPNGSVFGGGNAEWQKKERQIRGRLADLAGVENGVADWLLLVPSNGYHGLLIEFKAPKGVLSDAQEAFLGFAMMRGYCCQIHTDPEAAWAGLTAYLTRPTGAK